VYYGKTGKLFKSHSTCKSGQIVVGAKTDYYVKQSGFGRTHGRAGLLELVNAQHIHVNHLWFVPDLWWFNYTPPAGRLFRGFARRFASGSILQASLLLPQMIRRWLERRD